MTVADCEKIGFTREIMLKEKQKYPKKQQEPNCMTKYFTKNIPGQQDQKSAQNT